MSTTMGQGISTLQSPEARSFAQLLLACTPLFLSTVVVWLVYHSLSPNRTRYTMVSWKLYKQCRQSETVTSELAKDPSQCPLKVFRGLYHGHPDVSHSEKFGPRGSLSEESSQFEDQDELQKARACGNWGSQQPSKLFLQVSCPSLLLKPGNINLIPLIKVFHDALCSLEKNPFSGVISPPLMGSTGVLPLTIVAPLPDLCRHLANCIVRAEHEVFLGTNFWIHSDASTLVTNAIRKLSRRAGERGRKVVMKMVYDRGDPRQVCNGRTSDRPT